MYPAIPTDMNLRTIQDMEERAMGVVYYGPSEQEKGNLGFRRFLFVVEGVKKENCLQRKM